LRKRFLAGALIGTVTLAVSGVAVADHETTNLNVEFSTKSAKAGTKRAPRPVALTLEVQGGTTTGTGQPATSTQLNITLPRQFRWNGRVWPRSRRCNPQRANEARSDSVCPRGSRVGSGHVTALGGGGAVVEEIDVTAYVTAGGDLGLFIEASQPVVFATMLVGEVNRGRVIQVDIPTNVQEPLMGVPTGIRNLRFTLNATTRVKGERRPLLESNGCKNRRWTLLFRNVYRHAGGTASKTDSDTARCRR
jgi:hypothetical protein